MHSYLNATFHDFKIPSLHSGLRIVNYVQKSWLTPLRCSSRKRGRWLHWGLLSRMGCDISSLRLCSHPRPDRPRSDSLRWSLFLLVSWPLRTQGVLNMQASVASLSLISLSTGIIIELTVFITWYLLCRKHIPWIGYKTGLENIFLPVFTF